MWCRVIWLDIRVCLIGTIVTQIVHTKKWKETAPQLCMISSTRNNRNYTKYAIYEVSQNKSPVTRCDYVIYMTLDTRFSTTILVYDSGPKIQDPKTIQQCIKPTFRVLRSAMTVLHFLHRHGPSHSLYQVPHRSHRTWATNVNHMTGKYLWCGWRLNFG